MQRAAIDPDSLQRTASAKDHSERRQIPQLRFLRTKEPPRPATYSMYSLERALEHAGVEPLPASMSSPDSLAANVVQVSLDVELSQVFRRARLRELHVVPGEEDLSVFVLDRNHPLQLRLLAQVLRLVVFLLQAGTGAYRLYLGATIRRVFLPRDSGDEDRLAP